MLNIYVVGCGGIGGYLCEMLPMAISSLSLDVLSQRHSISEYLTNAGNISIPCVVDRLVLIDGDTFNPRNAIRQGCGAGSKLVQRLRAIDESMIRQTYLQRMRLSGVNAYIKPSNMSQIIPKEPAPNNQNPWEHFWDNNPKFNCSVVFLCVDNVKTRYEVSKYMEGFDNAIVINGGNEKTTGHVTVYERSQGQALDPNIMDVYPNITPDADKRPDEEACTNVAPKHDQIAVTNSIVANMMMAVFNKWVREGLTHVDKRGRTQRKNEVIVDTDNFTMMSLYHPISQ